MNNCVLVIVQTYNYSMFDLCQKTIDVPQKHVFICIMKYTHKRIFSGFLQLSKVHFLCSRQNSDRERQKLVQFTRRIEYDNHRNSIWRVTINITTHKEVAKSFVLIFFTNFLTNTRTLWKKLTDFSSREPEITP